MRRRLIRRVPVRVRQSWRLLLGCAVFAALCGVVLSTVRVAAVVTSEASEGYTVTEDVEGTVSLFDLGVSHELALSYDAGDYERLLDSYFEDGEKDWMKADLVVDGTLLEDVGIRLKGNSTLQGLTRPGVETATEGRRGRAGLSTEDPANLPWLLDMDKYADGRAYQGHDQFVLRVAGMGGGPGVLNEALAVDLLAASGQPAQDYTYTSLSVNGSAPVGRLLIEHMDVPFAEDLGDGVLYKQLAGGSFTYQGDDPTEYADDFKQVNLVGDRDLAPVIAFLKWLDAADDAGFAAELGDRVDVDGLASYVAAQNLLLNFDDMAGPGKNLYLWYDEGTGKLSVVTWDMNLAFSGSAEQGPYDEGAMGGGEGFPGGDGAAPTPGGEGMPEGLPEGAAPPGAPGGGFPGGGTTPDGAPPEGGGMSAGNALKERFLAAEAFHPAYENAYRELYTAFYADGGALAALDRITTSTALTSATAPSSGDGTTAVAEQAQQLRELVTRRTTALAADEVITG
ncbi:CotH kinase family protein [Phytomonospora sp. NPDC050363]|uniref:CotH kinase family protein n=1 Tax=Phytomonospora sp. NPDC050363 TaxID=3155642 RepID=UPI0033DD91E5